MGPSTLPNGRGHCRALNDPLNLNALTLTCYLMLGLRVVLCNRFDVLFKTIFVNSLAMLSDCIARLLQAGEKTLKLITKNMLKLKCTKYLFAIMIDCPLNTLLTHCSPTAHPLLTHCSPTAHPLLTHCSPTAYLLLTLAHLLLVKTHPKSSACKFSRTTSHKGRSD
jgi:hypothetical protein